VSYRPYLEPSALRHLGGLPERAFDMLVTLLARICDDPYDPVFSATAGVPRRQVADVGDLGGSQESPSGADAGFMWIVPCWCRSDISGATSYGDDREAPGWRRAASRLPP
jgi:hypothetical protein